MPVIEINLPSKLARDVHYFATNEDTDVETFIIWAVAELMGALREQMIYRTLRMDERASATLFQKIPAITEVTPLEDFALRVKFESGQEGVFDMKPFIFGEIAVFPALSNLERFKVVTVSEDGGFIQWEGSLPGATSSIGSGVIFSQLWHSKDE